MRCAECDRLRAELAEAREQLAAWEAYDAQPFDAGRLARWMTAFKATGHVAAVLMMLADARDGIVSRDQIVRMTRLLPGASAEEPSRTLPNVLIYQAKAVLERCAIVGAIASYRGLGWNLPPQWRHQVLAMVGETA